MAKISKSREVKIDSLKPYERNAKIHGKEQVEKLKDSIREFGFLTPCLIDADYNLIAGHGRVMAAKALGMDKVPCVFIEGLSEAQRRAYVLADNRLGELGEWDMDLVNLELTDLDEMDFDVTLTGFELEGMEEEPVEIIEDEPPEEVETRCKLGDVWQLGEHRLICGDSTDVTVIDKLMDGQKVDMVFTDPPYNVDYSDKNKFLNQADEGNRIQTDIENDSFEDDESAKDNLWLPAFYNMRIHADEYCSIYVTMPQGGAHMMMMMSVHEAGWQVKHELIWVKNNHVLGRTDYFYKHEPILYGWNKKHKFYGLGKFDKSVWEIPKPQKSDLHPTMKPIELIANALQNSTKEGDNVLDVFGGSGSTLIACEQLNRKCFMCELDPHYCDVIIQRWEKFTGRTAVLTNG